PAGALAGTVPLLAIVLTLTRHTGSGHPRSSLGETVVSASTAVLHALSDIGIAGVRRDHLCAIGTVLPALLASLNALACLTGSGAVSVGRLARAPALATVRHTVPIGASNRQVDAGQIGRAHV